jgi:microsomal dipeptidase-like Zn-dependent dipeptidase
VAPAGAAPGKLAHVNLFRKGNGAGVSCAAALTALAMALFAAPANAGHVDLEAEAEARAGDEAVYDLAGSCAALQPQTTSLRIASTRNGYDAAAIMPEQAESFTMQATDLGSFLLLGSDGNYLSTTRGGDVVGDPEASPAGDWRLDSLGSGFTVTSGASGEALGLNREGKLALVAPAKAETFAFASAEGCIPVPEAELNVVGKPQTGATSYGETRGLVDAHMHIMAFEAFGGGLHCGRPWSPLGIEDALVDCPDHYPNGSGALVENIASYTDPTHMHDPVGWPTFSDWPDNESYTHENTYYRWIERTYRSGLRLIVQLAVDNSALCFVNPQKTQSCNEMQAVDRQLADMYELQDYIDAQYGGPGEGWFRIVRNPFQARRVINEGKLAVILGIEVSEPFNCGIRNDEPQCTEQSIDADFDKYYKLGVRQMEMANKFDNALSGVAFDGGTQGIIVNVGNRQATGRFWAMETCTSEPYDRQPTPVPAGSVLEGIIRAIIPQGALPVYPEGPVCNPKGLTDLGEHFLDGMMERGMLFDPDHMSVRARKQALNYVKSRKYQGLVSSHSWSDDPSYKRIYKAGGFVAAMKSDANGYLDKWKEHKDLHQDSGSEHPFALGFADDMNGFSGQPGPRDDAAENPLPYPVESPVDEGVQIDRQISGERVFDLNEDGIDHFGLYADWVADLKYVGGDKIIEDMAGAADAYLETWERAVGVPDRSCLKRRGKMKAGGYLEIGMKLNPKNLLRRGGQPEERPKQSYRYCVKGKKNKRAELAAVFSDAAKPRVQLIVSDARSHRIGNVHPGSKARRLSPKAQQLGPGLHIQKTGTKGRRYVFGVRNGKVEFVGVASRAATRSKKTLKPYLRLGGV